MLMFEDLRHMLIGFATEPVQTQSDPRYVPIMDHSKSGDGFIVDIHGYPTNYKALIYPERSDNTAYMGILVQKEKGSPVYVTLRVAAYNACATYEFWFNFGVEPVVLEMRVGDRANASFSENRTNFQRVRCVDLVVLDLVELMLPPQLSKYRPEVYVPKWGVDKKPCILCGTSIPNNWYLCGDCHPAKVVTTV